MNGGTGLNPVSVALGRNIKLTIPASLALSALMALVWSQWRAIISISGPIRKLAPTLLWTVMIEAILEHHSIQQWEAYLYFHNNKRTPYTIDHPLNLLVRLLHQVP